MADTQHGFLSAMLVNSGIDWLMNKLEEAAIGDVKLSTLLLRQPEYASDIVLLAWFGELL